MSKYFDEDGTYKKYTKQSIFDLLYLYYIENETWESALKLMGMTYANLRRMRQKKDKRLIAAYEQIECIMDRNAIPIAHRCLINSAAKGNIHAAKIILEEAGKLKTDISLNIEAKIIPIPVYEVDEEN